MLHHMKKDFPKTGGYTFKTFAEDDVRLEEAARLARRKKAETGRLLLQRALDLFEKDFKIAENAPPVVEPDPKEKPADEAGKKENRAGLHRVRG